MRRTAIRWLVIWAGLSLLGACGFKLRGQAALPFASVHIEAPAGSAMKPLLIQHLELLGKRVLPTPQQAQVVIRIDGESRSKDILSLSGGGKVREYRLGYRLVLAVTDAAGRRLLPPSELRLTRDFSYDDAQALAKAGEEAQLHRDMEQEMLRQVLRRLSALKP